MQRLERTTDLKKVVKKSIAVSDVKKAQKKENKKLSKFDQMF